VVLGILWMDDGAYDRVLGLQWWDESLKLDHLEVVMSLQTIGLIQELLGLIAYGGYVLFQIAMTEV